MSEETTQPTEERGHATPISLSDTLSQQIRVNPSVLTVICTDIEQATHVRRIREGEVQIRGSSDETVILPGNANRV